MSVEPDIIYTKVDEAPELASGSFLPIIQAYAKSAGVNIGFGGDEFAVLMPNQTLDLTRTIAERLARLFGQMPWPHEGVTRPTLSIGIANAWCNEANASQELFRRADTALYNSKNAGRDSIRTYHASADAA